MPTGTPSSRSKSAADWRAQLKCLITTMGELEDFLGAPLAGREGDRDKALAFPMRLTPYYAGLIRPGDPLDPIARQAVPCTEEAAHSPLETLDPLAEERHSPVPGLVHRYKDRALLLPTGFCPVFCRFCLRKRSWSGDRKDSRFQADAALAYLGRHTEIREVILSGGDPLFLPDDGLDQLLVKLRRIPHVRLLRIGTRAPAVLPARIDAELLELLSSFRPIWMITHFNHPRELTPEALQALEGLREAGVVLNNQSVLLRGVNDSTDLLIALSEKLLESGVRPYYLHQVDHVAGASHFRVPIEEGKRLIKAMFGRTSGLGIPRYVLDLPGGKGKVPLMPDFEETDLPQKRTFLAPLGGWVELRE